jgi:hypothetical protein
MGLFIKRGDLGMAITTASYKAELLERPDLIDFMYRIISTNMAAVMGDELIRGENVRTVWYENNIAGIARKRDWKTVIALDGGRPCGYFQYGGNGGNEVFWSEMEIDASNMGDKKTFLTLVRHFLNDEEFKAYKYIRGYINGKNIKSQLVFTALGMKKCEETARGARYIADRADIERWVLSKNSLIDYTMSY